MNPDYENKDVLRLRQLYEAQPKRKPVAGGMCKAKRRELKTRSNAYLTEMDLRRIHFFRYGSESPSEQPVRTFKEVSRLTRLPPSTCFYAIRRF